MSHVMRKPVLPYANNQGVDQPARSSLISTFVVRCLDSIIPQVFISEISSIYLASVATPFGIYPGRKLRRQAFLWRGSIICSYRIFGAITDSFPTIVRLLQLQRSGGWNAVGWIYLLYPDTHLSTVDLILLRWSQYCIMGNIRERPYLYRVRLGTDTIEFDILLKTSNAKRTQTFEPPRDKTNKMAVCSAKTQISQCIRPVWSASSLCAQWVAQSNLSLHWAHKPFCCSAVIHKRTSYSAVQRQSIRCQPT